MRSRPWRTLARHLSSGDFERPYIGQLRGKLDVEQAQEELEKEIQREMASALGRAEDKVNLALYELEVIGREITALTENRESEDDWAHRANARVEAFNCQRGVAQQRLWELVIHREALGFRRNAILREFYPIPPRKQRFP
jgi:hypothetical protein